MSNYVIGISIALLGGVIQTVGFILQKKGHNQLSQCYDKQYKSSINAPDVNDIDDTLKDEDKMSVTTVPIWWCGIILYQIGNAMRAISLSFAPQSIISPLLAFNIAINCVLTYFILNEKITRKDVIAIILIIIGILLIIIFGPNSNDDVELTVSDLRLLFQQIDYIIFVSILTFIVAIDYIVIRYIEYRNFASANSHEIAFGKNILLLSYTFIAGYFKANNTLFIKSLITMISSSFESVYDYLTYFIAVLWIICLLSGEYFRQRALSYFGATFVVPLDVVVYVVLSVFLGAIVFDEFNEMNSVLNISLFFVGLVVTLCAVMILSYDFGKYLDELYSEIIKVAYIDPKKVDYKEPSIAVFGGIVAQYFSKMFFEEIPFFINTTIKDIELTQEKAKSERPSFSWNAMRSEERTLSQQHLKEKLGWLIPFSIAFTVSIFLFAKYELSFYHFGSMWILISQLILVIFLYRGFESSSLHEVRSRASKLDGFSQYISFCSKVEEKKDTPIYSVCRFAGVRGSTQELLFSIYVLGEVSLATAMLAMKAAERGTQLFVNTNTWDQGRRTDITLIIMFPMVIALFFLYIIAVVEHGSIGRNIHLCCGLLSVINQPIAFMVHQNFSIFSIICMITSLATIVAYKVNGNIAPNRSDDIKVVHKWSLINLTIETVMIIWASGMGALIAWVMDGDVVLFQ